MQGEQHLPSMSLESFSTWFFVFYRDGELPWYKRFLCREFEHVSCFAQLGTGVVKLEPTKYGLLTSYVEDVDAHLYARAWKESAMDVKIVKHHIFDEFPKGLQWAALMVPSCVSLVMASTGFWAVRLTPDGLLKSLLARGGWML